MAKQCWSQAVLESGSWGHSVLQTPALVIPLIHGGSSVCPCACIHVKFYILAIFSSPGRSTGRAIALTPVSVSASTFTLQFLAHLSTKCSW